MKQFSYLCSASSSGENITHQGELGLELKYSEHYKEPELGPEKLGRTGPEPV